MSDCIETKAEYSRTWYKGKRMKAHRKAYTVNRGPIPPGMVVRHKCDNPKCINPEHLELGTQQDNVDDMMTRGRRADTHGVKNPKAKLNPDKVWRVRKMRADGYALKAIGERFGISLYSVNDIVKYRSWKKGLHGL